MTGQQPRSTLTYTLVPYATLFRSGGGARQQRLVAGPVEHRARVVGHAAVDRHVGAHARHLLDGADRVERDAGLGRDRPSGLGEDAGLDPRVAAGVEHRAPPLRDGRCLLVLPLGTAAAATELPPPPATTPQPGAHPHTPTQ